MTIRSGELGVIKCKVCSKPQKVAYTRPGETFGMTCAHCNQRWYYSMDDVAKNWTDGVRPTPTMKVGLLIKDGGACCVVA